MSDQSFGNMSGAFHTDFTAIQTQSAKELNQMLSENLQADTESDMQTEHIQEAPVIESKPLKGAKKKDKIFAVERQKPIQESSLIRKDLIERFAEMFAKKQGNIEYRLPASLLGSLAEQLGGQINEEMDPQALINAVIKHLNTEMDPDACQTHKALEFLEALVKQNLPQASAADKARLTKLATLITNAKEQYNALHEKDITIAAKLIGAVDAVVEATQSKMDVKETLDRYRSFVHSPTPPDVQVLRRYYEAKGYDTMLKEFKGLAAYLGANFKRAGVENPELLRLGKATRTMQALQGVFRQSKAAISAGIAYLRAQGVLEEDIDDFKTDDERNSNQDKDRQQSGEKDGDMDDGVNIPHKHRK